MKTLALMMDGSPKDIQATLRFISDAIKHDCQGVRIISPAVLMWNNFEPELRSYGAFLSVGDDLQEQEVAQAICQSFRRIFFDSKGLSVTVCDLTNHGSTFEEKLDG